jgi:NADH-quinone oxidoreductase subunit G
MAARPDITLVVDGLEVQAPEGEMLVDAAKGGDVEIPVFCYEPKLGEPVGACRMCLVEVEGIPKLQTACSTPVRDGMVVYTQTDRVKAAQESVVEFLLINHPLDCPVCDKGGECPLQDVAMGWGPGRSRYTDPKRHFQKPIPLSPLVKIDRERCILCYRCVRFSQEVAEDEQLQLLDRGAATFVGTFDDRPYIAPFHGNITELCPVGALTSETYRFRARPWDIEDAGSVCTLCPSQCNVKFTVRDEHVQRVLARDNHEVDDGWLCDKGRFGFQMFASEERITQPLVRSAGELRPATWEQALDAAAEGLRAAGGRSAAIMGGTTSNEEGYLAQRIMRAALGSPHVDSRARTRGTLDRHLAIELSRPELAAKVGDIDAADSILILGADLLHQMPILDLRVRKAIRRSRARVAIASDRPTSLDGGAEETARFQPGGAGLFVDALAGALGVDGYEPAPDELGADAERIAGALRPGSTVIVWSERMGAAALDSLLECAWKLELDVEGAGLIEVPEATNARGLREVGCLPGIGPGLSEAPPGKSSGEIRDALIAGELDALVLLNSDPVRDFAGGPAWTEALRKARFVVACSMFEDSSTPQANVVFPAESHAEKEGTVTHPDGRLQRLRPNIPHPGEVRPGWQVLAELSARLGHETEIDSAREALAAIAEGVPFYAGITPEEIGGLGVRWQEREAARQAPAGASDEVAGLAEGGFARASDEVAGRADQDARASEPEPAAPGRGSSMEMPEAEPRARDSGGSGGGGGVVLGTYRDLWSGEVTERNPALRFLAPKQTLELAPADANRLALAQGEEVEVGANGSTLRARVAIRERMRPGAAFLIEGTAEQNANALEPGVMVEVARAGDME